MLLAAWWYFWQFVWQPASGPQLIVVLGERLRPALVTGESLTRGPVMYGDRLVPALAAHELVAVAQVRTDRLVVAGVQHEGLVW